MNWCRGLRLFHAYKLFVRLNVINTYKIKERSFDEVLVDDVSLNIGRSYRKEMKELLSSAYRLK
mgnify:CR=1 FL=1